MPQCINNVSTHIIYHIHLLPFSLTQQSLNSMETRKESIIKWKSFPFTKTGHHLEHQFLTFKSKKYIKYCFFLITTMLTFLFQHTTSFAMVLTGVFLWHSSKNHNHSTTGGQQHEDLTFGVMVQRPHQSSFVNTSSWLMNGKLCSQFYQPEKFVLILTYFMSIISKSLPDSFWKLKLPV